MMDPPQDQRTRWYKVFQDRFLAASLSAAVLGKYHGGIIIDPWEVLTS